jgi:hypothetical protein
MDGPTPREIILDIGNENYDPVTYGRVAAEILDAVRDFRRIDDELTFKVALQAMQSGSETRDLIRVISHNSRYDDIFSEVDIIRVHDLRHTAEQIAQIETSGPKYWALRALYSAVLDANRDRLGERLGPEINFSAWTTFNHSDGGSDAFAFESSHAMLSLFSGMLELGADYAAAWGFGTGPGLPTAMSWYDSSLEKVVFSPAAIMLSRLSKKVVGFDLIDSGYMDSDPASEVAVFVFKRSEKVVIYAVNLGAAEPNATQVIDLDGAHRIGSVSMWKLNSGMNQFHPSKGDGNFSTSHDAVFFEFSQEMEIIEFTLIVTEIDRITRNPWGSSGNDGIHGTDRSDFIFGRSGSDELIGKGGDDRLFGGIGADNLLGGSGNDLLRAGSGSDLLLGGTGLDRLMGSGGNDTLYGGSGNDQIQGDVGTDLLGGGSGDDTLWGGFGEDTLAGGAGDDLLFGGVGGDEFIFKGAFGTDIISDFLVGVDSLLISDVDPTDIALKQYSGGTEVVVLGSGSLFLEDVYGADWADILG